MRMDIDIKYKNGDKICFYNLKNFKKKDSKLIFEDEDGFSCMDNQENISSLEIKMVECEDGRRFCYR